MTEQKCATCRYWDLDPSEIESGKYGEYNECRRHAPIHDWNDPTEKPNMERLSYRSWPTTESEEWCGDWEQRERPAPALEPESDMFDPWQEGYDMALKHAQEAILDIRKAT